MIRLQANRWPISSLARSLAGRFSSSSSPSSCRKTFDKILVANRGEIACRVIRTARQMGIKTVAIYSDIDEGSKHVRMADEAVYVGKAPALESYLDVNKVLDAIRKTGAQAVHPGYGFLSENTAFASKCEKEGVTFIGPPSKAIELMGDKIQSKIIAAEAGVNTIPGFKGVIDGVDHAIRIANDVGYPIMMKASAGGGGKGMRVAYNDDEVREGFPLSKAEALSSFNDDRMLVERYIEDGHHIEIQVLADVSGNTVAFPERECSVQRRNQKVLEESPSCLLDAPTRKAMQSQAMALAKAVGYVSAGTVEFIVGSDLRFYFLEMNTRLQVEHPVTECVTGADLVEEMICAAAGHSLSKGLLDVGPHIPFSGHAIEARVYAENPLRRFLPSTGPLTKYIEPQAPADEDGKCTKSVRVDSGVVEGSDISMFYDPMICKLITSGPNRQAALKSMERALDSYVIEGVAHNIPFLRDVCRNERFATGAYSTSFIPNEYPEGFYGVHLSEEERSHLAVCAAAIYTSQLHMQHTVSGQLHSYEAYIPEDVVVVLGGVNGAAWRVHLGEEDEPAKVVDMSTAKSYEMNVQDLHWPAETPILSATLDGQDRVLQYFGSSGEGFELAFLGSYQHVIVRTLQEQALSEHLLPPIVMDSSKMLQCPMPGAVVSIMVREGQLVEEGQQLAIVEAMKMQNVLRAERSTKVTKILCKAGDTLKVDQTMMEFEALVT